MTKSSHTHDNTKKTTPKKTRKRAFRLVDHPMWAERLSEQWDWEKNDNEGIKPNEITMGSHKRAWWRCEHGHEWQATVNKRSQGCGCPFCAGNRPIPGETDLATTMPNLAKEWHPTKNGDLTSRDIMKGSPKKVWWQCERGHEWQATVANRAKGCGCPYCSGRLPIPGETDLATTMPDLAREWHPIKNGDLTPQDVMKGSRTRVWWVCGHGHEWQATVNKRSQGCGCPYCAGKHPIPGETDLATTMPDLAREWHPTKNGDLTPRDVTKGSNRKVWWRCSCGHEWQATICNRAIGKGCPYCVVIGRRPVILGETDLATTMPDLAREWHPIKNGDLTPQDVTKGSEKRVWWRCEHGHEWQATVNKRSQGCGCPYCTGQRPISGETDLATTMPDLAREWHPIKNGDLTPQDVTKGSGKRVWWTCKCGHEWQSQICGRSHGSGCLYCAGKLPVVGETDLATTMPDLAREWHPIKNGDLTPQDVTKGSSKKVWWRCQHGHEWQARIDSRTGGCGCPKCSSSCGEKDAAYWAKSAGFVVQEQWRSQECRDKLPLPFDLMLYVPLGSFIRAPLMEVALVEYDGPQHTDETTYFNMKNLSRGGIDYVQRHDAIKDAYCEATGRLLIRVPYTITGVEDIGAYIETKLRKYGLDWLFDKTSDSGEDAA